MWSYGVPCGDGLKFVGVDEVIDPYKDSLLSVILSVSEESRMAALNRGDSPSLCSSE